ncbi:polyketide biosynthesis acyl-carrier-protein AcpK [Streptomyces gougerotii]|uniref:Polyketide biosynthesis acyl-carrier-protein AcpK n=3 Tax=Streptomyces TaxID=1883 RepID=A0A8H9LJG3_9ACTN|nr:Polyketide biosynthesis acyl-carrier-protein AcpK [Streptomyces sp. ADI98-12]SUP60647.1 ACP-II [Streptomyces griseus]GFH69063.1 polyketide biosynthesis acyl-carrier-protein AcpK [Streptomyces rutgersensis]GFH73064.1 polyketide biosynthesis acyl-carrier-protein AcpK [Streptomyces diastaticus subsp. diastaticus]GFH79694.1 polyketide biosynthesis acyl-carrier-protein AcpK [Streptomyces gougerotii]
MNVNSAPEVLEIVRSNIVTVVPEIDPAEVRREVSMADLGCNSIDRAEVVALTLEQLGVAVPVAEFQGIPDIGSLVDLLRKHL